MLLRASFLSLSLALGLLPATPIGAEAMAPATEQVVALSDLIKMTDVLAVMREEGLANGSDLVADLPGAASDPGWQTAVSDIYDPAKMRSVFDAALSGALAKDPQAIAAAMAFFGSELGQRALTLEIDARRALLDDDTEAVAKLSFQDMVQSKSPRLKQLEEFAEVNDLVESNVMGALNANLAFFRGMSDAGGPMADLGEDEMLATVWDGEAQVRADTQQWMFPFLALAYQPLSDEELQSYIAFSKTPEGKAVNAAVFAAFDALFTEVSRQLGQAVAAQMIGQDI